MASTFKTFLNSDIANTRTLLHEAIPITGTIASGTYTSDGNIKTFAHGMFESVYDYPYLSSSANHIFDITAGYSPKAAISSSTHAQNSKKINIYNQHAQILNGYNLTGGIQQFDEDGDLSATATNMHHCFFVNFARLLTKDEIKKGSFRMNFFTQVTGTGPGYAQLREGLKTIGDYGASTSYLVNSPAGEYGLLYSSSDGDRDTTGADKIYGHIYYQAGIAVLTSSMVEDTFPMTSGSGARIYDGDFTGSMTSALKWGSITQIASGLRFALNNVEFNNTTELNSTIYFCRANTQDYNYSANPTYLNASKIRVKNDIPKAEPVSYITTIGLYSADNELLAVAKLSEPLKKTPSNEIIIRTRLDY